MVEKEKGLNAKQAVTSAMRYFQEIVGIPITDISLEEIELSEDKKYWLVTLSYRFRDAFSPLTIRKDYKIFKVDYYTGEVVSMKIRVL